MATELHTRWLSGNLRYLVAELERLQRLLTRHAQRAQGGGVPASAEAPPSTAQEPAADPQAHAEQLAQLQRDMPAPPALLTLIDLYELTPFERDVLLLCAGAELSRVFCSACVPASGGVPGPSFGLALELLPDGHYSALLPDEALRRARLVHLSPGATLAGALLRINERVLAYLLGLPGQDESLRALLRAVPAPELLLPSQQAIADQARDVLRSELAAGRINTGTVIWLCGADAAARRGIAAKLCAELDRELFALQAADVPQNQADREELLVRWEREQQLGPAALLLCYEDHDSPEALRAATDWLDRAMGPLFVSSREIARTGDRPILRLDVPRPSHAEQVQLWQTFLSEDSAQSDQPGLAASGVLDALTEQLATTFPLDLTGISSACARARAGARPEELPQVLWQVCRQQARPRLDELAQRMESEFGWDDLVLPDSQQRTLRALVAHQRHRALVYYRWGFAGKSARGLGVSALFVGQSGTGKTLAAEVLARELQLDLYRIDLSQVISKYIGETEKNLRRVFDAAEASGAILLFDEADALFGKRTEVKDSHDRHANIEVSYLLQRMEAYRGVSILTSNMRSALDTAFLRRLRFIVHFPFPDLPGRLELWRRAIPSAAPQSGLNLEQLARLSVAGGHIRNIALGAAFLAASEEQPLTMRHLLEAAREEFAKLERPFNENEVRGWV